jgi:hypothetical protein
MCLCFQNELPSLAPPTILEQKDLIAWTENDLEVATGGAVTVEALTEMDVPVVTGGDLNAPASMLDVGTVGQDTVPPVSIMPTTMETIATMDQEPIVPTIKLALLHQVWKLYWKAADHPLTLSSFQYNIPDVDTPAVARPNNSKGFHTIPAVFIFLDDKLPIWQK